MVALERMVAAVKGEEAREKVLRERPKCGLLDIVLRKQNGFQGCRKLKQMEQSSNIPVILTSGKTTPRDKRWGLQQGADLYLTKPFDKEQLLSSVRNLTGYGL